MVVMIPLLVQILMTEIETENNVQPFKKGLQKTNEVAM